MVVRSDMGFYSCTYICWDSVDFESLLDYKKGKPRDSSTWRLWKGVEICFESGPQMLLQLYIISLAESRGTAMSIGNILVLIDLLFRDVKMSSCRKDREDYKGSSCKEQKVFMRVKWI